MSLESNRADYQQDVEQIYGRDGAKRYRQVDQNARWEGGSKQHYCELLGRLTRSFDRKVDVLDAGCGTGRYFRCLHNVRKLVGVDLSGAMIDEARAVAGDVGADTVELMQGDIFALDLEPAGFDFICSIGVVAEVAPLDTALLDKMANLLKPDGVLFLTAVDTHSRVSVPAHRASFGRRLARKSFPLLPNPAREALNRRLSPFYVTLPRLEELLRSSSFAGFSVNRYVHPFGWPGAHFDCVAFMSDDARRRFEHGSEPATIAQGKAGADSTVL